MNRRLLDIAVPVAYVIAILVTIFIGNPEWLGIVASVGALLVAVYYVGLRPSVKKADSST